MNAIMGSDWNSINYISYIAVVNEYLRIERKLTLNTKDFERRVRQSLCLTTAAFLSDSNVLRMFGGKMERKTI